MNLFSAAAWVGGLIAAIVAVVVLLFIMLLVFIGRYKKCPSVYLAVFPILQFS